MSPADIDTREFYTRPAIMTSVGELAPLVKALPGDPGAPRRGAARAGDPRAHDRRLRGDAGRRGPLDRARPPGGGPAGGDRRARCATARRGAGAGGAAAGQLPALHRARGGPAPRARDARPGAVRVRRVLRNRMVRGPLGVRVLGLRAAALAAGRRADRRRAAGLVPHRLRPDRRAEGPVPRRRRGLAPVPGGRGRPRQVRAQPAAGGRRLVDRRQPRCATARPC